VVPEPPAASVLPEVRKPTAAPAAPKPAPVKPAGVRPEKADKPDDLSNIGRR
jgi:hypothetical protein